MQIGYFPLGTSEKYELPNSHHGKVDKHNRTNNYLGVIFRFIYHTEHLTKSNNIFMPFKFKFVDFNCYTVQFS